MKGATWFRTIFFSLAKWCNTLASYFVSRRCLWLLKMDYSGHFDEVEGIDNMLKS
jgi:hypothetical protein